MTGGEGKWHARWGTGLLVIITWSGVVANFVEWREAVEYLRIGQGIQDDTDKALLARIERTQETIEDVKDKAELSARLEERLVAMQRQLDKMETLIRRR